MKKSFLCVLALLFASSVFAQSSDIFFKDYVSRTWNAEDGIPGNSITDIFQDKDGYILFGTYGGLTRFDGVKFLTFNKIYNEEYNFLSARTVFQDSKGNIWVGSNDEGAFCINNGVSVAEFNMENGLPNNSIRSFCEDKNGNVWIGTASGIACVSPSFEIIKLPGFDKLPLDNRFICFQLYCDTAGRVWIVTRSEKGLYLYSDQTFSVYEGIHSIENPVVTAITQDSAGAFWFGIAPYYGLKMTANKETLHNLGSGDQKGTIVTSIFQDSSKNIWFGLDNGITILHDGDYSYFERENGLSDENVVKIIEDKEKNIWIATDRGGIQKLSYGKFQTTSMPTAVNAIAQDKYRKCVWLGGDNGMYCYKDNKFVENDITKYLKNIRIRHVAVTNDNGLLVSTYEKFGQLLFTEDGKVLSWTKETGLTGNRVRVALQANNGDIYVGTTTGLSIIEKESGKITNIEKGDNLTNDYIMCLYQAKDGRIWVGTDGGGLFILKDKQIEKCITKENGLAGNVVFKIADYNNSDIWITTGTGVSLMRDEQLHTFDSSQGFGSDGVFQIIPDFSGRLWGTSNRGVFYVKSDDVEDLISGKRNVVNIKYFNRLDGITSGGVTSTSLSMKDDLGRIWFTLVDGFTVFDPVRNASKNLAPEVKIEDIYVDSEKYTAKDNTIILQPSTKRLVINYTGISFISSEQLIFKTKLAGFDKDYTEWSNIRVASYTNLKPGTYHFSVLAQNGDEVESSQAAEITVIKIPYLWQRPWFIILVVFVILAIVTVCIYAKMDRLRKDKEKTEKLSLEVISTLVGTIDAKDKYTNGHSNRVAAYSKQLAAALGENEEFQKEIYYAALLHDIGKIGIPDTIINKPDKLTTEEYNIIKTHPEIGCQILSSISTMQNISIGARSHHEHFDGSGYPDSKKGEEIPLIARIIGVADAYDAMTSNRSYRKYMKQADARSEIAKHIGSQFDPVIAEKMLEMIDNDKEFKLHE
ncbi:MAG: HD domain-containing protein [Treponema sp.]|nr:HD domain-containing protein [Treponema sp.]